MKLAIQGCSHGELDSIFASLLRTEREQSLQIDALLLCGDFQAIRNHADLHALAVPQKYRQLGDFHSYYSGEKVAPILTLVIGGNHEASNYMHELYHGGWLAPNIYFLGAAGVVELNGLVVAGISGIYKQNDYKKGRFEKLPYDAGTIRSCYHTRQFDVWRLKAMQGCGTAVMLSHDWPNTIEQWGDTQGLIRKKPFFKQEIETSTLGSPPLMELLQCLKPAFWFSAHLHVKFAAIYDHNHTQTAQTASRPVATASNPAAQNANPEAIDFDLDSDDDVTDPQPQQPSAEQKETSSSTTTIDADKEADNSGATTRFLALHKCLPQTPFLQVIDHSSPFDSQLEACKAALNYQQRVPPTLRYNKRWLAITRASHPYFSLQYHQPDLPDPRSVQFAHQLETEERWLEQRLSLLNSTAKTGGKRKQDELDGSSNATLEKLMGGGDELDVYRVQRFVRTAPASFEPGGVSQAPPAWYTNPQTEALCRFIGIENRINPRPTIPAAFVAQHPQQSHPEKSFGKEDFVQGGQSEGKGGMADPNALAINMDEFDSDCDESHPELQVESRNVVTLSDDDELHARWKEGTG